MEINIFYKSIRECIEDKLKKGDSLNMSFRIDSAIDSNKSNLDSKKLDEQKEVKPKIEVFGQKKYKEVYTKSGENQLAILVEDNSSSPYEFLNKLQEKSGQNLTSEISERQKIGQMDLRELTPSDEMKETPKTTGLPEETPPTISKEKPEIKLPESKNPINSESMPEFTPEKIDGVTDKIDAGKPVTRQQVPREYNSENPHPNAGKTTTGGTGYSMVVQDDGSYKYYNPDGQEIPAEEFRQYNPNMYSSSLTQNWVISDKSSLTHKRGNVTVSDYNYQLIKSFGDPALYQKSENGRYVNAYTGEVINENVYNQLCKAYEDITA